MIYDKIKNLKKYESYLHAAGKIADYLKETDLTKLECGTYELFDGITLNISEYEPFANPDKWEAHRKYIDLQIVVCGNERMDSAPIDNAEGGEGFHDDDDYELYASCGDTFASIYGDTETFAVFEPADAHRPGIFYKAKNVKKAVFKIPV